MDTLDITLVGISIPADRLRVLRPDSVEALAESMAVLGQLNAIVVRQRDGGGYWLIAGRHRFEAAKKLKWKSVRCSILDDCSADEAELAEIDENLIRADLSPAETALHVTARKPLYEKLHPETKAGGDRKSKKAQSKGQSGPLIETFTKDTSKKTGKSQRSVKRDVTRGKKVKVLADIAGTCLDKGDEIDALGKLNEDQQRDLAAKAKAGEKVSAKTKVTQVPAVLSDSQFAEKMRRARAKNASMATVEQEVGFAPPERCDLHCHLRTVEAALECGVRCRDWDAVCEGIALLQDAIDRTTERKLHA